MIPEMTNWSYQKPLYFAFTPNSLLLFSAAADCSLHDAVCAYFSHLLAAAHLDLGPGA